MYDTSPKRAGRDKRRSTRFTADDEARITALRAVYERKAAVDISDNDVIRIALKDACKVNKCEPAGGAS